MSNKKIDLGVLGQLGASDREHILGMVKGGATRREVMAWMMASGATVAVAGSVFGAAEKALANTPKRGGSLRIAGDQHGPADTLDPILGTASIDYFRGRMFYGSLVRLQDDLSYEPELAEEVLTNDDATEWTFKIRRGVEFHDGKTLTADDVVYSMNRHMGENSASVSSSLVDMVERWEKVNDYEVRAVLASPNADLPNALGTFHFKIVQDGWEDFSTTVGTGPYKVEDFSPGVRTIGVRNENYWEDGAYLDSIEHFGIGDSVSRVNAFMAGDVDLMANVPASFIEQIEQTEGRDIWSVESAKYLNIAVRMDIEPYNNPDLIKAMQYLMDRNRLVRGTLKGQGSLGNDHPIGPAYFDHCPDIPQRELDHDKAKWHFERSGIGSTTIPVITAEVGQGTVEQCLFLQREAATIGMNIDVQKVTTDGYWGAVWMTAPICVVNWNMRPTANIMLTLAYKGDAPWNESYWVNDQFDELLVNVRAVTDPDTRRQMYCDMQTLIHEEAGTILPAFSNYVDGVASVVQGRTYVPLGIFGGSESAPYLWRSDA
ncbi:MAG: ABC transporter substrate-binding protein [Alphaproteobacteria bacterium]